MLAKTVRDARAVGPHKRRRHTLDAFEIGRIVEKHAAGGAVAGAILAGIVTDEGLIFSIADLARETRAEYHAVWRCVQKLEELGVIEVEKLEDRSYRVTAGPGLEDEEEDDDK